MPENRFFGKYRATVNDNLDPNRLGRCRLLIPEVYGGEVTDWAYPVNNAIFGMAFVPPINGRVWAEFEAGDLNRPLYSMACYASPGGESEVPKLVREIRDKTTEAPVGTDEATSGSGLEYPEPFAGHAADYPLNRVLELLGMTLELDDTPGNERLKFFHKSGTYTEVRRDGSVVEKIQGRKHRITVEDDILHVNGKRVKIIEGDDEETIKGKKIIFHEGGREETHDSPSETTYKDDLKVTVEGEMTQEVDGVLIDKVNSSRQEQTIGSKNEMIGNQREVTVLETSGESVGNSGAKPTAKSTTITAGNYVIQLNVGSLIIRNAALITLVEFNLTTGQVLLGGGVLAAIEPAVLGAAFLILFNAHTHPETGGTTGPPSVPMGATELSTKVKVAL